MTREQKQLLIKDLCARLPYGVKMQFSEKFPEWFAKKHGEGTTVTPFTLDVSSIGFVMIDINNDVNHVKPYLRPMSSMTSEERKELSYYENSVQITDFYYSHHIDCRFMIEKGLALEAQEEMYKVSNE